MSRGVREHALKHFDDFKWEEQAKEAEKLQRTSPTLSLEPHKSKELFWVSVGLDPRMGVFFVSDCYVLGQKRLFGLIPYQGLLNFHSQNLTLQSAREALVHFLDRDIPGLRVAYGV